MPAVRRDLAIDYLRAAVTVLVVAHHAALAYCSFSAYDAAHYTWSTSPVVDAARWPALDYLVAWNDLWFMAMLFLLSGLFVPASLRHKGVARFLKDRGRRLGIPFVVAVVVLMPLAYYPSWRLSDDAGGGDFLRRFFTVDGWPVGPPWFLWLLLAFCGIAALAWTASTRLRDARGWRLRSPAALAGVLIATAVVATVLPRLWIDPAAWGSLGGPFDVQVARIPLYFAYFALGVAFGGNADTPPFSAANLRAWPLWVLIAPLAFYAHWRLSGASLASTLGQPAATVSLGAVFGLCCAATCLAALGIARAAFTSAWRPADSFSANAYGVYILHYPLVVWMQYALLDVQWPAALKSAATFAVALGASWAAIAALRRTPARALL